MERLPLLVHDPLAWKPVILRRDDQSRPASEPMEGTPLDEGRILYLRPHPRGFVGLGLLDPSDTRPGIDLARMPDPATAKHLIEHARNLGPLPRPTLMLPTDAFSFAQLLPEVDGEGPVRRWYGVRRAGTYVIERGSRRLRLTFERDDNSSLSQDLMSFADTEGACGWPEYLQGASVQIALALRLITLHEAAMARAAQPPGGD